MRKKAGLVIIMLLCCLLATTAFAAEQKTAQDGRLLLFVKDVKTSAIISVPIASTSNADLPVADVNGDIITVDQLRAAIGSIHAEQEAGKAEIKEAAKIDLPGLLQRLINVELIVQEARNIGLDELPEVKASMAVFSQVTLRDHLRQEVWKDVTASDEEIEKEYRQAIREVRTTSVFFEKESAAKKALAAVKKGKAFDAVIAQAIQDKTAHGDPSGEAEKFKELDPAIAKAIATMKTGQVGPLVKKKLKGKPYVVLFRYDAERFPENDAAREQARKDILNTKRIAAIGTLITSLNQKYVKMDKKLFESINYGSKGPGVEKLLEDKRILVAIKDAEPVTVANLSDAMLDKFYHGMKNLTDKKIQKVKQDALEALVQKQLLYSEAIRRGLDKSETYRNQLNEYERNTVFGAFIQQVVTPNVKVTEDDFRAYYKDHAAEFKSEPLIRVQNIVFMKKETAASALEKMKKGADISWIMANMPGQVEKKEEVEPTFDDAPVPFSSLAEDVQGALAGARAEDARLFESRQGHYHILYVKELVPPRQLTYEEVRASLGNKVYYSKMNRAIDDWIQKLKRTADVKIYLSDSQKQ